MQSRSSELASPTGNPLDKAAPGAALGCVVVGQRCNQAFFTKIILTEDWKIEHTFEDVYETVMQPENRLRADYWQRTQQLHSSINLDAPPLPDLYGNRVGIRAYGGRH